MAEVNPLVVTEDGNMLALDAKVTFDDNALFRHKPLEALRDLTEEDDSEIRAANAGLSYVKLDGNIGCLVNGAGLAMSTMDLIKLHGGEPANFLDVGGGAKVDQVTEAFRIILADNHVRAVIVNIFGGIMKCDTIVEALLVAYEKVGFNVPLVVRLEGTNVEIAQDAGRKRPPDRYRHRPDRRRQKGRRHARQNVGQADFGELPSGPASASSVEPPAARLRRSLPAELKPR